MEWGYLKTVLVWRRLSSGLTRLRTDRQTQSNPTFKLASSKATGDRHVVRFLSMYTTQSCDFRESGRQQRDSIDKQYLICSESCQKTICHLSDLECRGLLSGTTEKLSEVTSSNPDDATADHGQKPERANCSPVLSARKGCIQRRADSAFCRVCYAVPDVA